MVLLACLGRLYFTCLAVGVCQVNFQDNAAQHTEFYLVHTFDVSLPYRLKLALLALFEIDRMHLHEVTIIGF